MFETEIKKDDYRFTGMGNLKGEKVVLLLTPESYSDQFEKIRFREKVAQWGYETVVCAVSSQETRRISTMGFDDLNIVVGKIDHEMKLLKESHNITLVALGELAGISLLLCLNDYNILKIILLNPLFCSGISVKLSRIEIPTFILYSGNPKTPSASSSRKYHDLIAGSSLHNMPGTQREEMLEKRTQFFSYLKTFLADDQ